MREAAGIPREDGEGLKVGLAHVQRLLGHSDPKLTAKVYTHVDVEDLRVAVVALPRARKGVG